MRFKINALGLIIILLSVSIFVLYIYLVSNHRLQTFPAWKQAVQVSLLPNYGNRCKKWNDSHFQCLPNILFIGASKCGTTSITRYLREHPSVKFVNRRVDGFDHHLEIHRFDRNTYDWSLRSIELADEWTSSPLLADPSSPLIHYTPQYIYAPSVPFEVREFYPHSVDLKFIVSIREPIARALSSYWFKNSRLSKGRRNDGHPVSEEPDKGNISDFGDSAKEQIYWRYQYELCMLSKLPARLRWLVLRKKALVRDSLTLTDEQRSILFSALQQCFTTELFRSPQLGHFHIDKGIYVEQLLRWFVNFPSKNFLILSLEQLREAPEDIYDCLLEFIGTPPSPTSGELTKSRRYTLSRCPLFGNSSSYFYCCKHSYLTSNLRIETLRTVPSNDRQFLTKHWLESPNSKRSAEEILPPELNKTLVQFYSVYDTALYHLLGGFPLYDYHL